MRRTASLLLLLVACGGSTPISGEDLLLRIDAQSKVALGRAFPLTVVRVWSRDLTPAVWNDAVLAPLKLKLIDTRRRENDERVEETRHYEGYAFGLEDIVIPAPELRAVARRTGAERVVTAEAIEITVQPALAPTDSEAPELPGEAPTDSRAWIYIAVGAVAVALGALLLVRKRTPAPPPPAPPTDDTPSAADLALVQLATAGVFEIPDVLRTYIAERWSMRTQESSSEELLASAVIEERTLLAEALGPCDLAKFAGHEPTEEETDITRGIATRFVEETA